MARFFDDASSEYLENDTAVVGDVPLTLAAWIYSDDVASGDDQSIIFVGDKDVSGAHFMLRYDATDPGDFILARHRASGPQGNATAGTVTVNTWHHAAAVFASDTSRTAYFNGSPGSEETTNVTGAITPDRISIGRAGDSSPGNHFSGRIAETAVWDAALTAPEIASLSKGFSPLFIRPQNLVFYAPLIRDEDLDRVGGLSLTAFNTPTVAEHTRVFYPTTSIFSPFVAAGAGISPAYPGRNHPSRNIILRL